MKQKPIKKPNKKNKKKVVRNNFVELILLVIISLSLFSVLMPLLFIKNKNTSRNIELKTQNILVTTEKNFYNSGEDVVLFIENNFNKSIYLEPCEFQNRFERKNNDMWYEISSVDKEIDYDKSGFNKEKKIVNCKVRLSPNEKGVYRSVIQAFYDCKKPEECRQSEIFYSNEFRVL
ncbi:MAG: hypothetical protein KAS01_02530 [Candidatus Pacebacteria bacterium]|nr:hypothetical protein [Candidatus Paceibacterota bacterium]